LEGSRLGAAIERRILVQTIDPAWISQAQKGDSEAFTILVELFQKPVFNLCYRMLGNAEDAEDAAQETFIRAYQSLRRYDLSRPFGTWLLSIAAHYCIDQLRRRRYPTISLEDMTLPDLPDASPGIENRLTLKEERRQVQNLLEVLDPLDRAAVIMYYWYDLPYEEICRALNLTSSAVKSRLHRARRLMAGEWQKKQPEAGIGERMLASE
jgi:RNA polymerase sigma-70 factor (ECF subfamily)